MVGDIMNIRWISLRGGTGIDPRQTEVKDARDVPVIAESEKPKSDVELYYVRVTLPPYRPQPGQNDVPHKDVIVYVDPRVETEAYIGVQNPDQQTQWTITRLPGYGPWLKKEIDLYLRGYKGM